MSEERAKAVTSPVATPWGTPPEHTKTWQLSRQEGATWERCLYYNAATGIADREWPLADLHPDTIPKRWGSGTYRIQWMGTEGGAKKGYGKSAAFRYDGSPARPVYPNPPGPPSEPAAAPAPALLAPAPKGSEGIDALERMMAMVQAMYAPVFQLQAQTNERELERQRTYHAQTLELVKGQKNDRVERALVDLAKVVNGIGERLAAIEGGEEEEEPGDGEPAAPLALPPGLQLSDKLQALLGKAVERFGEQGLEAMAEKLLGQK